MDLISIARVNEISQRKGIPVKEVELESLRENIIPARYLRNIGIYGVQGQIKLLESTVAVVGSGGLGGWIIEILARTGIGKLIVIDGDTFEETNLNRQLLLTEKQLGYPKVEAAKERIKDINSAVEVETHYLEIDLYHNPVEAIIKGADVVVDALDGLEIRLILQEAAEKLNIPCVHGAAGGTSVQVTTIFPGDKSLEKIYGPAGDLVNQGIEETLGTPSPVPALCASWQAQEVTKYLTGKGELLRNKLLFMDASFLEIEIIDLGNNTHNY